jgi:hypothetical protein
MTLHSPFIDALTHVKVAIRIRRAVVQHEQRTFRVFPLHESISKIRKYHKGGKVPATCTGPPPSVYEMEPRSWMGLPREEMMFSEAKEFLRRLCYLWPLLVQSCAVCTV